MSILRHLLHTIQEIILQINCQRSNLALKLLSIQTFSRNNFCLLNLFVQWELYSMVDGRARHKGLVICNWAVGVCRIQNNMTKILNPPLRATETFLTPFACKIKKIWPPTFNVKSLTSAMREFFNPIKRNAKICQPPYSRSPNIFDPPHLSTTPPLLGKMTNPLTFWKYLVLFGK